MFADLLVLALMAAGPHAGEPLRLESTSSFTVYPADCNHMGTLFGGRSMAEMDRGAGVAARRLLRQSAVRSAVTVSADIRFLAPARVGDTVTVHARVVSASGKLIRLRVRLLDDEGRPIVEGSFIYAAYDVVNKRSLPHGLDGLVKWGE